ncbi:MAG: GNAT family N-acetyltransferase, partial [Bacteroidaceae bacterium]|nr:GNAT family N-acetyltransferase [Bacteroidaceae bacterium]
MKKYAMTDKVHIETYKSEYRSDFIRLNREWIETFFRIEDSDIETFSHVDEIVEQGGQIFLAVTDHGEVAGCCALKHHRENESYELAKMA